MRAGAFLNGSSRWMEEGGGGGGREREKRKKDRSRTKLERRTEIPSFRRDDRETWLAN